MCRPNVPVTYIDEATREPRVLVPTPEVIKHWHDNGKEMLKAELSIPVPLEHQPHLKRPLTRAERAAADLKNNAGWVNDYKVAGDGAFWTQLNVEDEDVYKKLPRTIKFVSPYVTPSVKDGDGRDWNNVITHVALTSRPRIKGQAPFGTDVAAALSLASSEHKFVLGPEMKLPDEGLSFSAAGQVRVEGAGAQPLYPAAFSVLSGAALAEGYDEEESPPPKKGGKGEGPKKKAPPPEESDEERAYHDEEGEGAGPAKDMTGVACRMMKAMYGVELGKCDESNFAGCLVDALMQRLAEEKGNANMPETQTADHAAATPPPAPPPRQPQVESQPMYMALSLEEINALTDPGQKMTALAFYELRQQNEKHTKARFGEAEKDRKKRVDAAVRRMPKRAADFLKAEYEKAKALPGMGFALGDDGAVVDSFEAMLAMAESFPDVPALLAGQGKPEEMPQPQGAEGLKEGQYGVTQTPEQIKNLSDDLLRAGGLLQ